MTCVDNSLIDEGDHDSNEGTQSYAAGSHSVNVSKSKYVVLWLLIHILHVV